MEQICSVIEKALHLALGAQLMAALQASHAELLPVLHSVYNIPD